MIALPAAYGLALILLFVFQRRLQYLPDRRPTPVAQSGMTGGEDLRLETSDGETLVAWHFPPERGRPVILYFHGAAGALVDRVPRLRPLVARGYGLFAVSFRGYAGSTGSPTEDGLILDAETAYREAALRYGDDRLVIMGASLGTAIAVAVAAKREALALVLLAPFLSAMDVAARRLPMLPVKRLMRDQYRTDLAISGVCMPVLMIHGARDRIVPITSGERLFALAREPKRFLNVPHGGHVVLGSSGVLEELCDWIDRVDARRRVVRRDMNTGMSVSGGDEDP
ncbi:MAG TPA: alpha/beta hydrolase [Methylocystis sp.]|nr:alpha/beta hydrolase [Methylocystis sp.]